MRLRRGARRSNWTRCPSKRSSDSRWKAASCDWASRAAIAAATASPYGGNTMSSIDYINGLAARGIQLWAQDGKLQYKAPKEAITPQLLAELKQHKATLVALLEQFADSTGS